MIGFAAVAVILMIEILEHVLLTQDGRCIGRTRFEIECMFQIRFILLR